jgi:DNA-binding HxlR family transcriptional regulator
MVPASGLGQQDNHQLPMTQDQLADSTGLTPVHVNRNLKALEADGLIERADPRSINIGNWKRLAEAGDFNSAYLHMPGDEPALAE